MTISDLFERSCRLRWLGLICLFATGLANAGIPAAEREVLLNLYTGTNGAGWKVHTNWNGAAGTECAWFGVTCDSPQEHVVNIELPGNNLSGSLPALTALSSLETVDVSTNQLSGGIPPLIDLTNLQNFYAYDNQLSGNIPPLAGLTQLGYFYVYGNQLTGPIPALTDMPTLCHFNVGDNQLTGGIPGLAQLTALVVFNVKNNQLDGILPPLAGLSNLSLFNVGGNRLTGTVPNAPNPSSLAPGGSGLCPNQLSISGGEPWDAATGYSPWWAAPHSSNLCDDVFSGDFE